MADLQNNPDPVNYAVERGGDDLTEWRVTRREDDNDEGTEVGVYETYTEAVAAVNEDRGVDPESPEESEAEQAEESDVDLPSDAERLEMYEDENA